MLKVLRTALNRTAIARRPLFPCHPSAKASASASVAAVDDSALAGAKPIEEIPGYPALPFVGTSWVFYPIVGKFKQEDIHLCDYDKFSKFGEIFRDVFSGRTVLSVCNEVAYEALLRHEGKMPNRAFATSILKYREMRREWFKSVGIILLQGQEWYDLRFKLQKYLMKPRSVDRYVDPIVDVTRDLIKRIVQVRDEKNEVPDVMEELFKWSLESVAYVGLETRIGCLDPNAPEDSEGRKMIKAVQTALECMNGLEAITGSSFQLWQHFPTPLWRKFVKSMDYFTQTAFKHVQNSVDNLKTKELGKDDLTLLQSMLANKDLKPDEAMTMVVDMMMAGIDTTSNTTGYFLFHLARNPDKQEKLYEDICRFLPSPSDRITPEMLLEMKYLKSCFKEAIRLHPVIRGVGRITEKDLVLCGYRIPAGTVVLLLLQISGRLEKYFKDADKFLPERWMSRDSKPSPFLYFPFGFGTRSCIGRRIAEMEVLTLTTEIIRKFKVEYRYEDFKMKNRLVNVPDRPLKFAFVDRD